MDPRDISYKITKGDEVYSLLSVIMMRLSEEDRITLRDMLDDRTPDYSPTDKQVGGDHYKDYAIQPADFLSKNDIPFAEGSVIKYVLRHKEKGGVVDIEKAIHYLELIKEMEYGEKGNIAR